MSDSVVSFRREPKFVREPFDSIETRESRDLVKGFAAAQGVGYVVGPSGSGKTFLVQDWALRIAQGRAVLNRRSVASGVVYVAAEAPNGARKRLQAWKRRNEGRGLPFELIGQPPDLRSIASLDELAAELRLAADGFAARGFRLGLVVIDTLAASMPGGDENAGADMSAIMDHVQRLAAELACFVLIVSHTGKSEERGIRGWSGQHAGADLVVMLTREQSPAGGEVRVGRIAKVKEGEDGQRFAFSLDRVSLGVDADGDEVSSAVVVYEDAPESGTKPRLKPLNAPAQSVVTALARFEEAGQAQQVPLVPGVRLGTLGVTVETLRSKVYELGLQNASEPPKVAPEIERKRWGQARRKAFQRALQDVVEAGKARHEGDWVWPL